MLRRGVAYLPQRPSLFPHLSVEIQSEARALAPATTPGGAAAQLEQSLRTFRWRARSAGSRPANSRAGSSARSRSPAA